MVTHWGYKRALVWVDPETGEVWVGNDMAVESMKASGTSIDVVFGKGRQSWLTGKDHAQFSQLWTDCEEKLKNANAGAKGEGKGKYMGKGAYQSSK